MCGIAGIFNGNKKDNLHYINAMTDALHSRGPDSYGFWQDNNVGIALGHRRLAILDLSVAGHQPMCSVSGRYIITYNGEIYNYLELKKELEKLKFNFKGHSDTEILLAAIEYWGIEKVLSKIDGMYAFALWDNENQCIYLVRDRFGEKPLYYGIIDKTLIFASELKALREYKLWKPIINKDSLALFIRYSYILHPSSIYEDIYKLEPGECLRIDKYLQQKKIIYWSAEKIALNAKNAVISYSEQQALNILETLLSKSVQYKSIADVSLGVFLSGGIDSSLIAAMLQNINSKPIKTFTIGFNEENFNNEAPFAKIIAQQLGSDHTELYVSSEQAKDIIPKIPIIYDEPFADSSQLPTSLICQLASEQVTVALTGDGGDEIFGGYNRYIWANKIYNRFGWLPHFSKQSLAYMLRFFSESQWDKLYDIFLKIFKKDREVASFGMKLHKVADALKFTQDRAEFYRSLASVVKRPEELLMSKSEPIIKLPNLNDESISDQDYINWMMLADTATYLPGDILTKVDRAAMAVSLETRVPYLDPKIFEFMWQLPLQFKIYNGQGKYLLRKLLYKYVPQKLMERPKVGFGVPIGKWIKSSLRDWTEDLFDSSKIKQEGFFDATVIQRYWKEHLLGKNDWTFLLWNVLVFQEWYNSNKE